MKVLFVCKENQVFHISPIIKNQGESLIRAGLDLDYYIVKGQGIMGYLRNIYPLHKQIKKHNYDIIHAHYSWTAFITSLASAKPLVVSLMGSDVKASKMFKFIIRNFNRFFWDACIVKSKEMKKSLGIASTHIIPNGVNFNKFKPMVKEAALKITGFDMNKKQILFAADPDRYEKNFALASKALKLISDSDFDLHYLKNVPNDIMPYYYNASDVILLTSDWEGSPNVIKEAMACSRPIVSTNVGDVYEVINGTDGCYISNSNAEEIAFNLEKALKHSTPTNGRNKIQHLDEKEISNSILDIYKQILMK